MINDFSLDAMNKDKIIKKIKTNKNDCFYK